MYYTRCSLFTTYEIERARSLLHIAFDANRFAQITAPNATYTYIFWGVYSRRCQINLNKFEIAIDAVGNFSGPYRRGLIEWLVRPFPARPAPLTPPPRRCFAFVDFSFLILSAAFFFRQRTELSTDSISIFYDFF